MTDRLLPHIEVPPIEVGSGWAWRGQLRQLVGFLLLFALTLAIMHFTPTDAARTYPHPLWLPVIVISLHLGLEAGIAAVIVAIGVLLWEGLPPQIWTEDAYQYFARISAEPIGWTCAALLIGYMRRHQIRERSELRAELAESEKLCQTLARRCDELRTRTDMLERHIAANGMTSLVDIAETAAGD